MKLMKIKKRRVETELRRRGFVFVRTTAHSVWKHPDGTIVTLPVRLSEDIEGPVAKRILSKDYIDA